MLPYLLLLFVSFVIPLIIYRLDTTMSGDAVDEFIRKRNKTTIILFFLGFIILLSLRDITVGRDLHEYKIIFNTCIVTPFKKLPNLRWELGFTIYNKLISFISKDYRFFLIITAIIILFPIYKLYSQEKKYSFLIIVLFLNMPCFLMIFSGLRQAIATSIGVLAYLAIKNKRYFLSVLLILLAMTFHVSAFVLVLIYPAQVCKVKTIHLLCIVPAMLGIYFFRLPILSFAIRLLPSKYVEAYGEIQQTGAYGMLILFLIFLVFSFVIMDETAMSKQDYFMRNILLISTLFQFFVPIHGLIQRASYYFLIFVPISIMSVVQSPKRYLKNISNLAVIVIECFFVVYFFFCAVFSTNNMLDVFPYKFFWSGEGW